MKKAYMEEQEAERLFYKNYEAWLRAAMKLGHEAGLGMLGIEESGVVRST